MKDRSVRPRVRAFAAWAVALGAGMGCTQMDIPEHPRQGRALGGRVAVVYSPGYLIDLGGKEKLHPFDIHKYARIYRALTADGLVKPRDVFVPAPASRDQLLLVHTPEYLERLNDPETVARAIEVPALGILPSGLVGRGIVEPFRLATGGTIEAARQALACGVAVNLAGGYHHARSDRGEGFNLFNDLAVAIRVLQSEGLIRRAAVVDLDVHQGNGTAVLFAGDESVYTFSMHERDIYPIPKETSDLDVNLPAGVDDEVFLETLATHLPRVLDSARADIVFLQAGCDTLEGDPLARLRMTPQGVVRRDAMVIDECVRRGIPVAMVLGGGYSPRAWEAQHLSIRRTIETHAGPAPRATPNAQAQGNRTP